jgi:hypothetical protein
MQITSINKRDGVWHVGFAHGDMIGSRIYSDPYRLLQFLVDSGFVLDRISYDALKGQVFDIETVMKDIETLYKERSFEKLE